MKPVVIVSVAAMNYELFEGYTSHADLVKTIDMLSDVVITNIIVHSTYDHDTMISITARQRKKENKSRHFHFGYSRVKKEV